MSGGEMTIGQRRGTVRDMIENARDQIAAALPQHVPPERMMKVAISVIQGDRKLLKCSDASLVSCLIEASSLGLVPDGVTGLAYLVPYGSDCQLQIGYRGLIQLARRSGELSTIHAEVVHDADTFSVTLGLDPNIVHEVDYRKPDRGPVIAVYAAATLKDGGKQFVVMTRADVEAIRAGAPSKNSPAWKNHWGEMAKKVVIKRLCKVLPISTEDDRLQRAVGLDNQAEDGSPQTFREATFEDVTPPPERSISVSTHEIPSEARGDLSFDEPTAEILAAIDAAENRKALGALAKQVSALPESVSGPVVDRYQARHAELSQ